MTPTIEPILPTAERIEMLKRCFASQLGLESGKQLFLVTVPLRVCPLGAHSDHQGGIVSGLTIDRSVLLLAQRSEQPDGEVFAANFGEKCHVHFNDIPVRIPGDWGNYLRGAVRSLSAAKGALTYGFRGVVHGAMPIGGLSSSAAVTIAYLKALAHVNGLSLSALELIMLVRATENGYLGLHNGILDQSVIVSGRKNELVCIDCSDHTISTVPASASAEPWEILVVYSGLSRQLTATPFNQRVAECHEAARELLLLQGEGPSEKPLLGDVPEEVFEAYGHKLPENLRRRARHFFTERARVRRGIQLWRAGDTKAFGALITESGRSSIENYEAGSPALISLYEIMSAIDGVYGTRFCGGGFQGCCLALIDPRKREAVAEALDVAYTTRHPELADDYSIHFCQSSDSVSLEAIS
jgi:galactokinase